MMPVMMTACRPLLVIEFSYLSHFLHSPRRQALGLALCFPALREGALGWRVSETFMQSTLGLSSSDILPLFKLSSCTRQERQDLTL